MGFASPAIRQALAHKKTDELCKKLTGVKETKETAAKNEFLITWL